MRLEAKEKRKGEANAWETALARRLAEDLDAFLEEADAETFFFADETLAARRLGRIDKRRRFKTLATVAASFALLLGGATAIRFYFASPQTEKIVQTRPTGDEPSLIAWSVESLSETEWARRVEAKLASADVFELYASSWKENETAKETGLAVAANESGEENEASEVESNEWFSVEKLADVAALEPLKYEPFLQAVVAALL